MSNESTAIIPEHPLSMLPTLLEHLHQQGIRFQVDDYPRIYTLVRKIDDWSELDTLLTPLLAKSEVEQALVQAAVRSFIQPWLLRQSAQYETSERTVEKSSIDPVEKESFAEIPPPTGESPPKAPPEQKRKRSFKGWMTILFFGANFVFFFFGILDMFSIPMPGNLEQYFPKFMISLLIIAAVALVLGAILEGIGARFPNRKLVIRPTQSFSAPFYWNFDLEVKNRIRFGEELTAVARQFRKRLPANTRQLDIKKTLKATIENAGAFDLRYRFRTRPAEYLLLIDNTSLANHQTHLFELLYRQLLDNNIYVERYYYNDDVRVCWNEKYPQGITLEALANRYADYRLLIFGDCWKLVHPVNGQLLPWTEAFSSWKDRAVLSPRPTSLWGQEEAQLSELFSVFPSNLDGLLEVVDHFEQLKQSNLKAWRYEYNQPGFEGDPSEGLTFIQRHFTLPLQDWIAASAIYPELSWDLTLYLGEWLSARHNSDLLSFDNIAQLAQLPWFRQGAMPEALRAELLDALEPKLRLELHQQLVNLLEKQLADPALPVNSHAYQQFKLQLAIQKLESGQYQDKEKALKEEVRSLVKEGVAHDFMAVHSVRMPQRGDMEVSGEFRKLVYRQKQRQMPSYFTGRLRARDRATSLISRLLERFYYVQIDWGSVPDEFLVILENAMNLILGQKRKIIGTGEVLYTLLGLNRENEKLTKGMEMLGINLEELLQTFPVEFLSRPQEREYGGAIFNREEGVNLSAYARIALQKAMKHAEQDTSNQPGFEHLLLGLFETNGNAKRMLEGLSLNKGNVVFILEQARQKAAAPQSTTNHGTQMAAAAAKRELERGRKLITEALALAEKGDNREAQALLKQAVEFLRWRGDAFDLLAVAWSRMAWLAREEGEYEQSTELYLNALGAVTSTEFKDDNLAARYYYELGVNSYRLRDYEQAYRYYEQAFELAIRQESTELRAYILYGISQLNRSMERFKEALAFGLSALKFSEENGDDRLTAQILVLSAQVHSMRKEFDHATEFYREALKLQIEIGDRKGEADSIRALGEIFQQHQQFDRATELYQESIKIYEGIKDEASWSATLLRLAQVSALQGKLDEALALYEKVFRMEDRAMRNPGRAAALSGAAYVYLQKKEYKNAIAYFERVIGIDQSVGNVRNMVISMANIAFAFRKSGKFVQALQYYLDSLRLRQQTKPDIDQQLLYSELKTFFRGVQKVEDAERIYKLAQEMTAFLEGPLQETWRSNLEQWYKAHKDPDAPYPQGASFVNTIRDRDDVTEVQFVEPTGLHLQAVLNLTWDHILDGEIAAAISVLQDYSSQRGLSDINQQLKALREKERQLQNELVQQRLTYEVYDEEMRTITRLLLNFCRQIK